MTRTLKKRTFIFIKLFLFVIAFLSEMVYSNEEDLHCDANGHGDGSCHGRSSSSAVDEASEATIAPTDYIILNGETILLEDSEATLLARLGPERKDEVTQPID